MININILISKEGENQMSDIKWTHEQGFEESSTSSGNLITSDLQGVGGDGVRSIDPYSHTINYDNRQIYINDSIVSNGTKSLHHNVREYTTTSPLHTEPYIGIESYINVPNNPVPTEGDEYWARTMYYFASDFSWDSGSDGSIGKVSFGNIGREPKFFRVWYHPGQWINTYCGICRRPDDNGVNAYGALNFRFNMGFEPTYTDNDHTGFSDPFEYPNKYNVAYRAPVGNSYDNFKPKLGEWNSFESYVKFSSTEGVVRFWLNEILLYEFSLNTMNWTNDRRAPHNDVGIQTFSTWYGLPTTGGNVYTDDYMMTTDPTQATKTDDFGNKMIGRIKTPPSTPDMYLNDLIDVNVPLAKVGDIIMYNGTDWINIDLHKEIESVVSECLEKSKIVLP